MAKYANQKHITIHKEACDSNNIYATINRKAMNAAFKNLKPAAAELWVYFASNQNNYEFDLSQKAVENEIGMKKDQYDGAIKQLIEKGYLVCESGKTVFGFYEIPKVEEVKELAASEEESIKSSENIQKVGKTHFQKQEKPTFESGKKPRVIIQSNNTKNTTITDKIHLSASLQDEIYQEANRGGSKVIPLPEAKSKVSTKPSMQDVWKSCDNNGTFNF